MQAELDSTSAKEFTAEALLYRIDQRVAEGSQLTEIRELLFADDGWLQTEFVGNDERQWFREHYYDRLRRCLLWAEFNAPWHAKSVRYTVADAMSTDVVSVGPDDAIDTAQRLLLQHEISGLPVVDETNCLVGIVSECDILRLYSVNGGHVERVAECMKARGLVTVHSDELLTTATQIFCSHPYRRLPVIECGKVVGILSRRDILIFVDQLRIGEKGELILAKPDPE